MDAIAMRVRASAHVKNIPSIVLITRRLIFNTQSSEVTEVCVQHRIFTYGRSNGVTVMVMPLIIKATLFSHKNT